MKAVAGGPACCYLNTACRSRSLRSWRLAWASKARTLRKNQSIYWIKYIEYKLSFRSFISNINVLHESFISNINVFSKICFDLSVAINPTKTIMFRNQHCLHNFFKWVACISHFLRIFLKALRNYRNLLFSCCLSPQISGCFLHVDLIACITRRAM